GAMKIGFLSRALLCLEKLHRLDDLVTESLDVGVLPFHRDDVRLDAEIAQVLNFGVDLRPSLFFDDQHLSDPQFFQFTDFACGLSASEDQASWVDRTKIIECDFLRMSDGREREEGQDEQLGEKIHGHDLSWGLEAVQMKTLDLFF